MRSQTLKVEPRIFSPSIAAATQPTSICAVFTTGKAWHCLHAKGLFHLVAFKGIGTCTGLIHQEPQ